MLFKNGQPFSIKNSIDKDQIKKRAIFKLTKDQWWYDKEREREVCRRRTMIPAEFTYFDTNEGTSITVRYAKTANKNAKGDNIYTPEFIEINQTGQVNVGREDLELYWFLQNHPYNQEKKYPEFKGNKIFYEVDNARDAAKAAKVAMMLKDAMDVIWDYSKGMDEKRLRDVAKSYYISGVEDMTKQEIQVALDTIAKKDPESFLNESGSSRISLKATIQEALEKNIIYYKHDVLTWNMVDEETGEPGAVICDVRPGEDRFLRMINFFQEDQKGTYIYIQNKLNRLNKKGNYKEPAEATVDNHLEAVAEDNEPVWKKKAKEAKLKGK